MVNLHRLKVVNLHRPALVSLNRRRVVNFTGACIITVKAQKAIELSDITNHVGDSVKVRGEIFGVRYLEVAKNTPTFINVGAAYPNQLLTIVIWGDVRKKLGYAPEDKKFSGGLAIVTGKVELFKGKPQIVISHPGQLNIIYDEEVPVSELPSIKQN